MKKLLSWVPKKLMKKPGGNSAAPSPLTLDGLGLGGRPPGLDAPSEAETLQTEISESLSDALR